MSSANQRPLTNTSPWTDSKMWTNHVTVMFLKTTLEALCGGGDRMARSTSRRVVCFAYLSQRSYLSSGERSVTCPGWMSPSRACHSSRFSLNLCGLFPLTVDSLIEWLGEGFFVWIIQWFVHYSSCSLRGYFVSSSHCKRRCLKPVTNFGFITRQRLSRLYDSWLKWQM